MFPSLKKGFVAGGFPALHRASRKFFSINRQRCPTQTFERIPSSGVFNT
jgi:hypothetical protein